MWFLGSLVALGIIAFLSLLLGSLVLRITQQRRQLNTLEAQICSFIVGSGSLSLLFGWSSYLGLSGKWAGPTLTLLILILGITVYLKTKISIFIFNKTKFSYALLGLGATATIIYLQSLLFFHAYNPYNDTFTYISISDYIQQSSFATPAKPDSYYPMLTQALLYQLGYFRMGAVFFLGYVQSIMPVTRAAEIYPAVISWGIALNIMTIYLAARWMLRLPHLFALGASALAVFSVGPLYYAANNGFLPQLYGTAYSVYVLAMVALYLRKNAAKQFQLIIQISLGLSFIISAYSEIFPIIALIVLIGSTLKFTQAKEKSKWLLAGLSILLLTVVFANIEIYRMLHSLVNQINAVVGWDVKFSFMQFWETAIGLPTYYQISYGTWISNLLSIIAAVAGLIFLFGFLQSLTYLRGFKNLKYREKFPNHFLWVITILTYLALFIYFAFYVKNPWQTNQLGQTWSMFKITQWAYPIILLGIVFGIYTLPHREILLKILIAIALIPSLVIHYMSAENSTRAIKIATFSKYPFSAYQQLSEILQTTQHEAPIEIQAKPGTLEPGIYAKHREFLAYFLYPQAIVSDWREDGYINSALSETNISVSSPHVTLVPRSPDMSLTGLLPAGMAIKSQIKSTLQYMEGWYAMESDGNHQWHWASGNATFEIEATRVMKLHLSAKVMPAKLPLILELYSAKKLIARFNLNKPGLTPIAVNLNLKPGKNIYKFHCSLKGAHIGNDPRSLAFSLHDTQLDPIN